MKEPEQRVEFLVWKARATVLLAKPERFAAAVADRSEARARRRETWWGDDEPREVEVLAGESIRAGETVQGPAIVELPTTTIVVYPDWHLEADIAGNFFMSKDGSNHEEAIGNGE